jgi:hypothetical protein
MKVMMVTWIKALKRWGAKPQGRPEAFILSELLVAITIVVPTFLSPFTQAQVDQLKERWTKLRYARVDLWRQLGGGAAGMAKKASIPSGNAHPDYLLTRRSLEQLRGQGNF